MTFILGVLCIGTSYNYFIIIEHVMIKKRPSNTQHLMYVWPYV